MPSVCVCVWKYNSTNLTNVKVLRFNIVAYHYCMMYGDMGVIVLNASKASFQKLKWCCIEYMSGFLCLTVLYAECLFIEIEIVLLRVSHA